MGKIFYLMGKSSTGKDTIFQKLIEDNAGAFRTIVPYTTRPIRAGEKNGVEYFFVTEEDLHQIEQAEKLVELRAYQTCHGVWKYFTVNDQQINFTGPNCLMIGTLESYNKTKEFFGADKLVPILIELDDGVRLQRALDREKIQEQPKYEELCRRFLADSEDFSEDKIKESGIDKRFYNDNLERCIEEVKQYIHDRG